MGGGGKPLQKASLPIFGYFIGGGRPYAGPRHAVKCGSLGVMLRCNRLVLGIGPTAAASDLRVQPLKHSIPCKSGRGSKTHSSRIHGGPQPPHHITASPFAARILLHRLAQCGRMCAESPPRKAASQLNTLQQDSSFAWWEQPHNSTTTAKPQRRAEAEDIHPARQRAHATRQASDRQFVHITLPLDVPPARDTRGPARRAAGSSSHKPHPIPALISRNGKRKCAAPSTDDAAAAAAADCGSGRLNAPHPFMTS